MVDYKSFKLPGNATLRIRSANIIATMSSNDGETVDIFCDGAALPFHVKATKKTPKELIDYIWDIPTFEDEEDI